MKDEETDTETSNGQTKITLWTRVLTFNQSDEQHQPTMHTVGPIYKVNVTFGGRAFLDHGFQNQDVGSCHKSSSNKVGSA